MAETVASAQPLSVNQAIGQKASFKSASRAGVFLSSKELLMLRGHGDRVESLSWSPDGKRLATANWSLGVKVWDADTGKELLKVQASGGTATIAWSPDGKRLATLAGDP